MLFRGVSNHLELVNLKQMVKTSIQNTLLALLWLYSLIELFLISQRELGDINNYSATYWLVDTFGWSQSTVVFFFWIIFSILPPLIFYWNTVRSKDLRIAFEELDKISVNRMISLSILAILLIVVIVIAFYYLILNPSI